MSDCQPFVALWADMRGDGPARLNMLTRDHSVSLPLPPLDLAMGAVEQLLPELTRIAPKSAGRWLLLLEPSLPDAWHSFLWEGLTFGGRPLNQRALVVRHAQWNWNNSVAGAGSRFLNLFPSSEHDFPRGLESLVFAGKLRPCNPRYLIEDMAGVSDMFILAHGEVTGLVDTARKPFKLPVAHPMPVRMWLLSCNIDDAMDVLAKQLLDSGCKCVVAATGKLSAPEIEALVKDRFNAQDQHRGPEHWLAGRATTAGNADGGVHALTIWGEVSLDHSPCASWNHRTWLARHGEGDGLPLDDETPLAQFKEAYSQAMSPQTWPITRVDMAAPLLWLAEKHDHNAMRELERLVGETTSAAAIRALAAAARRAGNYVAMAKYLSHGLALTDMANTDRTDTLGALANLLIDLDLPEAAKVVIDQHQDCDIEDAQEREWADFKRLDWLARTEARRGRYHVALAHLATKRNRVRHDEGRELAGQLYLATWGQLAGGNTTNQATAFAHEAAQCLANVLPAHIGHGNDTSKYLLRSLAAYGWVMQDDGVLDSVTSWRELAVQRLAEHDPGPWAYLLVYLYLAGRTPLDDFECALASLENARYYLEAAMLAGLAGELGKSRRLLDRFHTRRQAAIAALDGQMASQSVAALLNEASAREMAEREAIGNVGDVARHGVLPL